MRKIRLGVTGTRREALVALKVDDDTLAWKVGSGNAGYASPALMSLNGETQIVCLTAAAIGIEPASGKELWSFPFPTEYDCNSASPALADGHLLLRDDKEVVCIEVKAQ